MFVFNTFVNIFFIFFIQIFVNPVFGSSCIYRPYREGLICLCNNTHCDTLEFNLPNTTGAITIVSTSLAGLRFAVNWNDFSDGPIKIKDFNFQHTADLPRLTKYYVNETENVAVVTVDSSIKYQKILGFGGALTGSVAYLLNRIDPSLKRKILETYFSKETGLGFTFLRTSIGGCDFDLQPWAYNELPEHDSRLTNFTKLDDRDKLKITIINDIKAIMKSDDLKIVAAAWSPPKWMKTNNDWTGFSALKSEYYETWANYHMKFLELMKQANVSIWGISTGNEPMDGVFLAPFVKFMSLGWLPGAQAEWVNDFLGPKLKNSRLKDVKLFAGDDQRYFFPWWFEGMENSRLNVTNYIDGFAVHWYIDGLFAPKYTLDLARERYPDKIFLNTESCMGDKPFIQHRGPVLGSWVRALMYINGIMQDLKHSVNGWIDWNLVLDEFGGPNYVNNFVDAPIILNITKESEAYKEPYFYVLGHYSRFIVPGSVRIEVTSSDEFVKVVGFMRPDNLRALVVFNSYKTPATIRLKDVKCGAKVINLPGSSIHSLLYFC